MNIPTTEAGTWLIVLIMGAITLATRWGGVFLMSFVPISRRVEHFISAMSGSVLVAVLAPLAATGDLAARLALLATATTMLTLKKPLPAITIGIAVAAGVRQWTAAA